MIERLLEHAAAVGRDGQACSRVYTEIHDHFSADLYLDSLESPPRQCNWKGCRMGFNFVVFVSGNRHADDAISSGGAEAVRGRRERGPGGHHIVDEDDVGWCRAPSGETDPQGALGR